MYIRFGKSYRNSHRKRFIKKMFRKKKPQACNFIKKETPVQVFSCEFCEILKNVLFKELFRVTASRATYLMKKMKLISQLTSFSVISNVKIKIKFLVPYLCRILYRKFYSKNRFRHLLSRKFS